MIEIDGVRMALELPATEAGDYISNEYWRLIDAATAPNREAYRGAITSASRRLNRNLSTSAVLVTGELAAAYNDVVVQLNEINMGVPGFETLELLTSDRAKVQGSGDFKWAA